MSNKITFVCIHGSSSSKQIFKSFSEQPDLNANILSFDLPAHGENTHLKNFSFPELCEFSLKQLSEINSPICLVGNSLGGHIAIEIAHKIKNLAGLVIFGTPPFKSPLNTAEAFLPEPLLANLFEETISDEALEETYNKAVFIKSVKEAIKSDFKQTNPLFRTSLAKDVFTDNGFSDEVTLFNTLTCKKYVIHGVQDPTVNLDYITKQLTGFTLYKIDQCGHFPSAEQPTIFIDLLTSICTELGG